MPKPNRNYKIAGIVLASILLIVFIGGAIAYSKREALLKVAIEKAIRKAKADYNLNVKIKDAHFVGLKTVDLSEITIVPENRDSLAYIQNFKVGIKLLPLIFGDIKLSEVGMKNAWISLSRHDSISNYDFLFRKQGVDTIKSSRKVNLAELANNLLNQLLYKIPDDMDIRNFDIRLRDDENTFNLKTTTATIVNGEVKSTILVNGNESVWHVQGNVEPDDKQLDLMLFADGKKVELPYLEQRFGLKLNFDTISTQMKRVTRSGDEFKISGSWAIRNLLVNQPRIASNDVIVPYASIDADMVFGENYVAIDSTSIIHLQNVQAHPFVKYTLGDKKIYDLKLHTEEMDAQQLFDAFPQGLFESLDGMKVAGKLQYDLNFHLDGKHPDNVVFDSRLRKNNFKVLKWGKTDLEKINSSFVYTPYEYGKPMRDIVIGPQNPDYTPINQISPYLRNALLTAEDPSFYSHNGFVEESIRKSIATNYKEKAFKRGGSTISMQLVKNVYLSRQKTLARKIEEVLIVWIMENTNTSSKNRMFEVYLNLIEWGRNVYGIGEASRHYFNKQPSQLDLGESIFLASIVPKPKRGMYYFEGDGTLKSSLRGYFRLIGGIMQRRGFAQPDSNVYGFYGVRLRESLRTIMPSIDSLALDSLNEDDENSGGILSQIFGKRRQDTIHVNDIGKSKNPAERQKTPSELRQERREQRRLEKEARRKAGGN